MATPRLGYEDLIGKLTDVIRAKGFDGTTLGDLAAATGLEKASLYHRFPGGKEEIVLAVVTHINSWLDEQVLTPLRGADPPAFRVRSAADRLREFYGSGTKACTLDTLSLPAGSEQLKASLRAGASALLLGFAEAARDSGATPATARRRAEQAVIDIEGSLVLARVTGNTKPFLRVMSRLPAQLTGTPERSDAG